MVTRSIADELEIRSLVHRYADAASRRDPVGVASTFISSGEWQAPELGHFQGRDALLAFFTSMLDGWNTFLQGLMSGVVVLDATSTDRAAGRWFVQEIGQRCEGTNLSIAGVYHDEYVRDRRLADHVPPVRSAAAGRERRGKRLAVPHGCAHDRIVVAMA